LLFFFALYSAMKKETRILVCVLVVNLRRTQYKTMLRIKGILTINPHYRWHAINTPFYTPPPQPCPVILPVATTWTRASRALYYANSILRGSSMYSFTFTRNVTASRPSNIRWSYVSATTITGLITICPLTTTGRSFVACIPSTAD